MAQYKFKDSYLAGYFYDTADSTIYSTKRGNTPYPIKWTRRSNGELFAQLVTRQGVKCFMPARGIQDRLDMTDIARNTKCAEAVAQAQRQALAQNGCSTGTFIVVAITPAGKMMPSDNPKRHATLISAKQEAMRLAAKVGHKFTVFQDCGTAESVGVQWT